MLGINDSTGVFQSPARRWFVFFFGIWVEVNGNRGTNRSPRSDRVLLQQKPEKPGKNPVNIPFFLFFFFFFLSLSLSSSSLSRFGMWVEANGSVERRATQKMKTLQKLPSRNGVVLLGFIRFLSDLQGFFFTGFY